MSYKNTFIKISEDSEVTSAVTPLPRNNKPIIASIEFDSHTHTLRKMCNSKRI